MKEKEFIYWLRGIVDSTDFMPTKKTWDTIQDKLKELKEGEICTPQHYPYVVINPGTNNPPNGPIPDNEPPKILC